MIDRRFVDVDLAAEARRLSIAAGYRSGGHFSQAASRCGAYGDNFVIQSDADRTAAIQKLDSEGGTEKLIKWILNQGQEGSCVGNACTGAMQILLAKQFGEANAVQLSAISMYKQIGSSPMSGADVEDAMNKAQSVGILPLDTPENRTRFKHVMPATGFYTPFPTGWQDTARNFRLDRAFVIRSVAEMEQACINGHVVQVGRAGHSIVYVRPSLTHGRGFIYLNSWGNWGSPAGELPYGFGYDTGGLVSSSAQWAYAFGSMTVPDYITAI